MSRYSEELQNKLGQFLHGSGGLIVKGIGKSLAVSYMNGMVDSLQLNVNILGRLPVDGEANSLDEVLDWVAIGDCKMVDSLEQSIEKLLSGYVLITLAESAQVILINIASIPTRSPGNADTESTIYGPQMAFTESMEQNIAVLRSYITNERLIQESVKLPSDTNTLASILYMDDSDSKPFVELIRERIRNQQNKGIIGSPLFLQLLQDNKYSLFPESSLSERPDRTSQALLEGKVVVIVEGNSQVIIGPNAFIDFFHSVEDRYSTWGIGLFNRCLRSIALCISIYLTPLYVAAVTYHYVIIPTPLLNPLISTRAKIPFPPLIEALILEIAIELLREAGARLPSKVGQTIGIVGGIVIGQAAVEAGFTSNLLIMLVALAALGSFTTPNYMMSSTIRIIRFPMLLIAGFLGLPGIVFLSIVLIIHLLRMTSYGKPYLFPLYPPSKNGLIRSMLLTVPSLFHYKTDFTRNNKQRLSNRILQWMKSNDHSD
ncbi:spore germination protein [Paenibacillus sp. D2_2]|uniref:spore germination protein n=1 Tax=Paenibacillus sp. D2_2 TaxID=3073092 RepID=UPI002815C6B5|nr:spore germination protein [Paenibacillus sp. D2_2]WMT43042.1 spore germination protein [Paenibacillus sp. D2_2]